MPRLIDRVLRNYPESDFSVRMKAELLFYVCIISFLCLPLIMVYTGYNQVLNTAPGSDPNFYVLIPHTVAMLLILVILHALLRGYYALSAHMLLLLLLFVAWMIMILERTSLLTRFDTVVYPVAFLSAVPLVVTRNRKAIPAYGILCFVLLTCFMWYSSGQLALPRNEIIEYMSDSTFAIIFTCMVAYSLFTINTKALNRAEHDISQRSKAEDDLRESQKRLMNVIDFLPDATLVIDNAKRVVVWNRAMERLTGVPSEEVLGKGDHCYSLPFYGQRR
ncbi:MAG TPA: PAS domain-containing protein, partial [Deltaproteobacteria bacterium]|nr:PAS domain-containing protein [Deltaproteobacteria bacterium]